MSENFTFDENLKNKEVLNMRFNLDFTVELVNILEKKYNKRVEIFCETTFGTYEVYYDKSFYVVDERNLKDILNELIEFRISLSTKFTLIWEITKNKILINSKNEHIIKELVKEIKKLNIERCKIE